MESSTAATAEPTIFVSIASYRDSQCQYTIRDLFTKAARPRRVVVGVCFQVAADDEDNFVLDLSEWSGQIRTYFLHHHEAKGPCYARALIQQELFRGEDYYFQIDSHLRFVEAWDTLCLEQLKLCDSPRPVLTTYASSYSLPKDYVPGEPDRAALATTSSVSILCAADFGDQTQDDPFLRIKTRICRTDIGSAPPPSLLWTARFAFSAGDVVREVPYDPKLEYIFFGEEIAMTARLWTSGWDLFNPTRVLAYHLGSRAHRPWFREVQTSAQHVRREADAKLRVCGLLGHEWPGGCRHAEPEAPYGLGTARPLAEYEEFAGLSFRERRISEHAKCGGLPRQCFAPQWAEDERERLMHVSQMQDPASWAGRGNADALHRQFPGVAVKASTAAEESTPAEAAPTAPRGQNFEAERLRGVTQLRVDALRAQLAAGTAAAATELELSRAFIAFGQVEAADGNGRRAGEAYGRALHHACAARDGPPPPRETGEAAGSNTLWRASTLCVEGVARLGLKEHDEAKRALSEALALIGRAVKAIQGDSVALERIEQLALDILDAVHAVHEQTDDRRGLEGYVLGLQTFLSNLRRASCEEDPPGSVPLLMDVQPPPQEGNVTDVRARLLERAVLVCIATGQERHFAVARKIFTEFRAARESPNMLRLLGILQSSGHLL